MTNRLDVVRGRPLPLVVPTAFVRIRSRGNRPCGLPATQTSLRCRAASRRVAGQ